VVLAFALLVVFLFNPVQHRVQRLVDRVFYRLEYDYQKTVQKISETMRSLLNLDEIGKAMMDTALGTMFIDSGAIMLLNREKESYECLIAEGQREKRGTRTDRDDSLLTGKVREQRESSEFEPIQTQGQESALRGLVMKERHGGK